MARNQNQLGKGDSSSLTLKGFIGATTMNLICCTTMKLRDHRSWNQNQHNHQVAHNHIHVCGLPNFLNIAAYPETKKPQKTEAI